MSSRLESEAGKQKQRVFFGGGGVGEEKRAADWHQKQVSKNKGFFLEGVG